MSDRNLLNVCFHGIGDPARVLEPGEGRYWVSRDQYLSILDSLVDRPNVRISFDDGNASDCLIGLPGLTERGLTATFFVLAGRLGQVGSLDRDHLAQLQSSGMRVGTHGMDHRPWVGLNEADRQRELCEARDVLRAATGREIDEAALPLGRYDRKVLRHLKELEYERVFTSDWRWARAESWLQPRFSMLHDHLPEPLWGSVFARPSGPRRVRQAVVGTAKRLR